MKGTKRILTILAVMLLLATVVVTAFAAADEGYTGNIDKVGQLLGLVDNKPTLTEKAKALDNVTAELDRVDPETEGYSDVVAAVDAKEREIALLYIADDETLTTADSREANLAVLVTFLEKHPFVENVPEGEEPFEVKLANLKLSILNAYLDECKAATEAEAKKNNLNAFTAYAEKYELELTEQITTDLQNESYITAKLFISQVEKKTSATTGMFNTAEMGAALRRHNAFVKAYEFPDTYEDYNDYLSAVVIATSEYNAAVEYNKEIIYQGVYITDLDKAPVYDLDFQPKEDEEVTNPNNNIGSLRADQSNVTGANYSFAGEEIGKDGENGYYTVKYEVANKHFRVDADIVNRGMIGSAVFECDFTTFGHLPNDYPGAADKGKLVWFENGSANVNGTSWNQVYISINSYGDIIQGTDSKNILVKNAVTPGEWVHIAIVAGIEDNSVDVYVDHELVTGFSVAEPTKGYTTSLTRIRIGGNPAMAGGEFSLDNVKMYQGHAPRDLSLVLSNEDDKFVFYANKLSADLDLKAKKAYYEAALRLVPNYYNGTEFTTENADIIAAVEAVMTFDVEKIANDISAETIVEFKSLISKIKVTRSASTFAEREYFLNRADEFFSANGTYILDTDALSDITKAMNKVRSELGEELLIKDYISYINNFFAAASVDVMQQNYNLANDMLKKLNMTLVTDPGFPDFANAYARHGEMETILYDRVVIDNSKRLLACISYVLGYSEAQWDENFDKLRTYVFMARDLISEGSYDPYYKDIVEKIEAFEPMGEYFVYKLRDNHINHISSELDRYDASSKYFERYGICFKLKEYIATSDIDVEDPDIAALIVRLEGYIATLEEQKEAYAEILEGNTVAFVEACRDLVGAVDYLTMKRVCAIASEYYYSMDVNDASVQDAISIYVTRCEEIEAVETVAHEFILAVENLKLSENNKLDAIVEASAYISTVNTDVEGVKEAIADFESECSAYNATINTINAELGETRKCVAYTSNQKGLGAFVTAILNALDD